MVGSLTLSACASDDPINPASAVLQLQLTSCRTGSANRATAASLGGGLGVTVAHTFDDVSGFQILTADGSSVEAELLYRDSNRDIALISFDDSGLSPSLRQGFAVSSTEPPDQVRVVYFRDDGPAVAEVEILRRVEVTLDGVGLRAGLELAADIQPGDSGAPLIDDHNEIVGVVFASARGGERGWAIASSEISSIAERRAAPIELVCE